MPRPMFDQLIKPAEIMNVREVQASDAKARLAQLLDDVERGVTIVITRHGRAIARLIPEADRRQAEIDQAIEGLMAMRCTMPRVSADEIRAMIDEGRKR